MLTDYRRFISRPLYSDALPLFSIEGFLRFSFFNYFYVSLSFFHHRVFFVLKWFVGWECVLIADSGQELRISWYWFWRKIWRYMENVNKFNFHEQTEKKCNISLKFIIEIIFNFDRSKWYFKVYVNLYRRLMDEEKSCIRWR